MRSKSKISLDLLKHMSWDCLLKNITERMYDSFKEDDVEKEVAFLAKNFQKFLKMKNSGKLFSKGKFSSSKGDRKEFKRKMGRSFNPLKELCVTNSMVIGISRRSVLTT